MNIDWSQVLVNAYIGSWYYWIGVFILGYLVYKFDLNYKAGNGIMAVSIRD